MTRGIGIFSDISNSLQCSIENGFLEAYNFCQNGLVHANPSKITKMLFFRKKKKKKIKENLKKIKFFQLGALGPLVDYQKSCKV